MKKWIINCVFGHMHWAYAPNIFYTNVKKAATVLWNFNKLLLVRDTLFRTKFCWIVAMKHCSLVEFEQTAIFHDLQLKTLFSTYTAEFVFVCVCICVFLNWKEYKTMNFIRLGRYWMQHYYYQKKKRIIIIKYVRFWQFCCWFNRWLQYTGQCNSSVWY